LQGVLGAAPTSLWSFAASHQGSVSGAAKRIGEMGSALYEKIKISFDGLDALQQMVQAHTVLNQLSSMVESAAMSASSVLAAPALADHDILLLGVHEGSGRGPDLPHRLLPRRRHHVDRQPHPHPRHLVPLHQKQFG